MTVNRLLEPAAAAIEAKIQSCVPGDETVLVRVCTDMAGHGGFGEQWIAVTEGRAVIVPAEGLDGAVEVPVPDMELVRTEPLVGGGRLEIERRGEPTLHLPYSASMAAKFSEVARGLEQLRQGKPFLINSDLDRLRCDKCGRLLPEKNGICPACIRKLAALKRIAGYLGPYKGRAAILALASIATAGAELVPPMITKHLVDDVLVPGVGRRPAPKSGSRFWACWCWGSSAPAY